MNGTSARIDFEIANNGTWQDALQFGTPGDTTWSFTGMTFHMDVKANINDAAALLSLTTSNGRIVVDDVVQRVLHFNVDDTTLQAALKPGTDYQYDLVMLDGSSPAVRVPLAHGEVKVRLGVTQS